MSWSFVKMADGAPAVMIAASPPVVPTAMRAGGIDAVAILQDGRILAADARQRLRVYAPLRRQEVLLVDLHDPCTAKMPLAPMRAPLPAVEDD